MKAWYLGCTTDQIGDRAILVGDRARVALAAELLDDPVWINEERGLATVTGTAGDVRITVAAFGMGAPIAAVVQHELAQLGVTSFLRLGTMMSLPPVGMGDLILASAAIRRESTSATYLPEDVPAVPDLNLQQGVRLAAGANSRTVHEGVVATFDGFYTQMAAVDPDRRGTIATEHEQLHRLGVIGIDMETSALFVVGQALGVRTASLCAATVDARTRDRLSDSDRDAVERDLIAVGVEALRELELGVRSQPTTVNKFPTSRIS